jgi:hypothetical protein
MDSRVDYPYVVLYLIFARASRQELLIWKNGPSCQTIGTGRIKDGPETAMSWGQATSRWPWLVPAR